MKIETNQSVVAYHIVDGAVTFNYAVDARNAASMHPLEWSMTPWSQEAAETARAQLKADGREVPDPEPLTAEDQASLDEYNRVVAEAAERLAAYRAKKEAERVEAAQVAADEAIVASAPPKPDPTLRRPFGRTGEPTAKEREQMEKRAAAQADRERIQKEKDDLDKGNGVKISS